MTDRGRVRAAAKDRATTEEGTKAGHKQSNTYRQRGRPIQAARHGKAAYWRTGWHTGPREADMQAEAKGQPVRQTDRQSVTNTKADRQIYKYIQPGSHAGRLAGIRRHIYTYREGGKRGRKRQRQTGRGWQHYIYIERERHTE